MESVLQEIDRVMGVTGSLVSDGQGGLLASTLPAGYDVSALGEVSRTLAKTIEALETTGRRKVSEMGLVYHSGRLVVRNLKTGHLAVLCLPNTNVPLLNLTVNAVSRRLASKLGEQHSVVREQPADASLSEAADGIVAAYPDIVSLVGEVEVGLVNGNRRPRLTDLGKDVGARVFRRDYAGRSVKPSLEAALQEVVLPAVAPFAIAKAGRDRLDLLVCPFCRGVRSHEAHCDFLTGLFQGLLREIPGLPEFEVVETACKGQGADACSFELRPRS